MASPTFSIITTITASGLEAPTPVTYVGVLTVNESDFPYYSSIDDITYTLITTKSENAESVFYGISVPSRTVLAGETYFPGSAISVGQAPTNALPTSVPEGSENSATVSSPSSTGNSAAGAVGATSSPAAAAATYTSFTSAVYPYLLVVSTVDGKPEARSIGTPTRSRTITSTGTDLIPTTEVQAVALVTIRGQNGNPDVTTELDLGTPFPNHLLPKNDSGGLSGGAGIGIGIAIAAAIAIVAFGFFFFCFRRRKAHRSDASHVSGDYADYNMAETKSAAVASVQLPPTSSAAVVYNNLPQPKEDAVITGDFSKLKSRIDNHVQNYYLPTGGNEKQAIEGFTHVFAGRSPVPPQRLSALLADPRGRSNVLRAAIAWIITERIHPSGNPSESFLPAEVAGAYASLSNNKKLEESTRSAFLSEWRVMTATLLQPSTGQDTPLPENGQSASIQSALREVDVFLAPLAVNSDHATRLRHLEEIMKRASRLGWTLFSQPSEYASDWTDEGRGIVVFPGLLQLTDGNGKALRRPRVFSQKDVVAL